MFTGTYKSVFFSQHFACTHNLVEGLDVICLLK